MRRKAWSSLGGSLGLALILSACGTQPVTSLNKKSDPAAVDVSVVQALQRHILEREKRIAELEAQLDALKVIDQDMQKLRKSSRPPATLTPSE
jgi:hypothetical protein